VDDSFADSWPGRQLLITQRLRARRAELGLTQKQVVNRLARLGVRTTNRALSSLEHGAGIDVAKLPELAAALDCTVTYLIGLTEEAHRWEPDPPSRTVPAASPAESGQRPDASARSRPVRVADRESLILGTGFPERLPRSWQAGVADPQ
jgi:transcriptional regulator with XRE-family HTH domain